MIMLDEVDKLGRDFRGDPASALLETLDPEQNFSFRDNYLDVPFDLSKVLFICTANMLDTVPPPLLDRMELIFLQGYSEEEKVHIANRYLIPRQIKENGITPEQIEFPEDAVRYVVRHYTREAGVRKLEQMLGTVCRKLARRVVEGRKEKLVVTREVLKDFLGGIQIRVETEVGGACEAAWCGGWAGLDTGRRRHSLHRGQQDEGQGRLHDDGTDRRSDAGVDAGALTWVRSNAQSLGLDEDFTKEIDLHIHVPAGAIPKDGPSAGVDHDNSAGFALDRYACASSDGHDGGDYAERQRAAGGWDQGEVPCSTPGGHRNHHSACGQSPGCGRRPDA